MLAFKRTPRLLDIGFEGWFMGRIATDPDPTNEERGMSGYTMALPGEDPLDRMIRFEADPDFWARNARPPLPRDKVCIGVTVRDIRFEGEPWPAANALLGASVWLAGVDEDAAGPVFESRNNITGSDDTMSFAIDPFKLRIGSRSSPSLCADDPLDPCDPQRAIWQIEDPGIYARRLTTKLTLDDPEVAEATGVFDAYGYFRDRRRYLERRIQELRDGIHHQNDGDAEREVQTCLSRMHQLEAWGDRVISKLGTRCDWRFDISGEKACRIELGGEVRTDQPWPFSIWFGGWDGDLLIGYTRGTVSLPFHPSKR